MRTASTFVAVLAFASWCLAACSAEVSPVPHGDGYISGGNPGAASNSGSSSGGSNASSSSGGGGGAGASSSGGSPSGSSSGSPGGGMQSEAGTVTVPVDAGAAETGSGYFIDSGAGGSNPTTPSGPPGSCTNPLCGTDGTECGCTATDSNGNTIQLGCQAGGECGCFENQQLTDQPFAEDGTCNGGGAAFNAFLQYCTCN